MRAFRASGYWVAEWLPQIAMFDTTDTGTFAFFANCDLARFSSRRVIANHRSAGISGALRRAMRQFVLHGLPTTRMRTSRAALAAVDRQQIAALHPRLARHRADQQRPRHAVERLLGRGREDHVVQQRERAVV